MKKVFPMEGKATLSVRQRADRMIARASGIANEGPDRAGPSPQQQGQAFDEDDQSTVAIQAR